MISWHPTCPTHPILASAVPAGTIRGIVQQHKKFHRKMQPSVQPIYTNRQYMEHALNHRTVVCTKTGCITYIISRKSSRIIHEPGES
ncbi:MAG TPA: hypothetical protein PLU49_08495 [Saprospiraceae bacterium]|nr:hypothetical protein [Saprospiraceae bacterium]